MTVAYNTAGTVSSPLDLDTVRGEHEAVSLNGGKQRKISPKPKVTLTSLTVNNTGTLRKINSVVLPIVYSDKFYNDVLDPSLDDINKLVYYADIPVGALCARREDKGATLAILTLAVLAPYRSQGLGTALVRHALKSALQDEAIKGASVHVQVGNDEAKTFYERLGFKEDKVVTNYYAKMEPRDAWHLVCDDLAGAVGERANGTA